MPLFSDEIELSKYKDTLVEYFIFKRNEKIINLLRISTLEFRFYTHDNWDSGFDVYDLIITAPLEMYVQIENQVDEIRNDILVIANKLIAGADRIGDIDIQIGENSSKSFINQELLELIDKIKILLTARATGQSIQPNQENEYKQCRKKLLTNSNLNAHAPSFIRVCSNLNEFWSYIKPKYKTYKERRDFIKEEMDRLINFIGHYKSPLQMHALPTLDKLNSDSIRSLWIKSINRLVNDPEGAITAAKTLLEDVIKNILNDLKIDYRDDKDDLPKLFNLVSEALNLSPAQHLDNTFKQILSGNISIVLGMSALRNKISDAHASGKRPVKPHKRHAEWVVNISGSLSTFLVATWEYNKSIKEAT